MDYDDNRRPLFKLDGIESVREALAELAGPLRQYPEEAHMLQDQVYVAVLKACALYHEDAVELARVALEIEELPFSRWYA